VCRGKVPVIKGAILVIYASERLPLRLLPAVTLSPPAHYHTLSPAA
jgi:hypothetical protein